METTAKRPGHKVTVCTGLACSRRGGGHAMQQIKDVLNIRENPVSKDGSVRLETIACSGNCHLAPLMMADRTLLTLPQIHALPTMFKPKAARTVKVKKPVEVRLSA